MFAGPAASRTGRSLRADLCCSRENTTAKKIRPNWDSHEDIVRDHGYWGRVLDTGTAPYWPIWPAAACSIARWSSARRFGRQPFMQGSQKGRDHNPGTFTAWMAGGGIRGGTSYGTSDELGFKAAEHPSYSYDLHATAYAPAWARPRAAELLSERHPAPSNGRSPGRVIKDILV